jgi:uncharacterized protein (TIGR02646 family)
MHYVFRGPEPAALKPIRIRYTQGWIDYYRDGVGNKPTDRKWREFINELSVPFAQCCGYCENLCKGEIDHYKPKNKFSELVYEWGNWVFSCHDCNQNKWEHWPSSGFLDPCAISTFCDRPQCCFKYDLKTGEVLPHPKLSTANRKRAQATIKFLSLNSSFHLRRRLDQIRRLDALLDLAEYDPARATKELEFLALPSTALHSLTKYYLEL